LVAKSIIGHKRFTIGIKHMATWRHTLTETASRIEARIDEAVFRFKLRRGRIGPLLIQPYRGHGTPSKLFLHGRVLEDKHITGATETASAWKNIRDMVQRFNSTEIPHARLRVRFEDQVFEAHTNQEGYFNLELEPRTPLALDKVWHEVELTLVAPLTRPEPVQAPGHVLVPPPQATFGVISDIDDTVVQTGAQDPLTMARIVVLNNPHTRVAFEGVAAFYQALRKGASGHGYNPIFYVSSSPWNLYDLLIDFLNINGIPLGPLFLRDVGLEADRVIKTGHLEHKLKQIRTILETHASLPFVLIGDSGQEDPEIYREVVRAFPGRIKAIYIRDVTLEARGRSIRTIIDELRGSNVEMVLTGDTIAAAEHALQHGLIAAAELPAIRAKQAEDQQDPTLVEQLPGIGSAKTDA